MQCYTLNVLQAGHGCSYHCALSVFGEEEGFGEQCWLSEQPEGAPGTQCPTFPSPEALAPPRGQRSAATRLQPRGVLLPLLVLLLLAAVLA